MKSTTKYKKENTFMIGQKLILLIKNGSISKLLQFPMRIYWTIWALLLKLWLKV